MVPYTLPSQKRSDAPLLIRDKRLASAAGHYARVELVRTPGLQGFHLLNLRDFV
jgi:hypothetical protein